VDAGDVILELIEYY